MLYPRVNRLSHAEALIALAGADQVRVLTLHERRCLTHKTGRQVDCSCKRQHHLVAIGGAR